jgi:outer membrane receptor protein involved in Fe transport
VIDQTALNLKASQHFDDLIQSVPNLTFTGGTSRPRYFQIRGIGENSQFEGETPDSSVRFLIDDIDLTGLGTVANLFDTRQVEVLRGPQAGAFGANAAGGVIQIVSNEPTAYWTGQVEGTLGTDALRAGGIAVGGPLIESDPEQLTFRFSLYQQFQNGFRENDFLNRNDTNERDELSSRLKLRWIANPDLQIDAAILYADVNNGYDEFTLGNTGFTTYSDEPGRDIQETLGISLKTTFTGIDSIEVINTTSLTTTDSTYSFDGDWGAGGAAPAPATSFYTDFLNLDRERDVIGNEFKINSAEKQDALGFIDRWTLGFYAQTIEEDSFAVWDSGAIWDTNFESESFALFGQATHELSESTRVIFQLRGEYYSVDVEASGDFYGTLFGYSLGNSNWLWGSKLILEQDLDSDKMLFASLSRGYKAGGASTPNFTGATNITYETETLWTVEGGLRGEFFDDSVSASFTAFYTYREDPQFRDSTGSGSFFDYITVNGEDATHYGLETEVNWRFAKNWSISTNLGLIEADYSTFTAAGATNQSRELANTPTYNYTMRLSYNPETGLFGNVELTGQDERYESNGHNEQRSAYDVVNASIGYRINNWTFTLWAKNLFDENYEKRIFFFDNGAGDQRYESPADPRHYGVTASLSF